MRSLYLVLFAAGILTGCSETSTKSPDVGDAIRKSLDQARLTDVSVNQDRDKGVVTLGGHVAADADKAQAESIAKSIAAGEIVANLDAALLQNGLHDGVRYSVTTGVV